MGGTVMDWMLDVGMQRFITLGVVCICIAIIVQLRHACLRAWHRAWYHIAGCRVKGSEDLRVFSRKAKDLQWIREFSLKIPPSPLPGSFHVACIEEEGDRFEGFFIRPIVHWGWFAHTFVLRLSIFTRFGFFFLDFAGSKPWLILYKYSPRTGKWKFCRIVGNEDGIVRVPNSDMLLQIHVHANGGAVYKLRRDHPHDDLLYTCDTGGDEWEVRRLVLDLHRTNVLG